jgi:hypothetical protein
MNDHKNNNNYRDEEEEADMPCEPALPLQTPLL